MEGSSLRAVARAPRRLDRCLDLNEYDARMVEKHATGSG
jgi:hypothetical protein